ncbi:MAG: leucine--tRNA ligase, partial [Bacillota bacterium]|nr:leucine--tRNA ligase [Bacillota bacterium]
MNRKYDPISIEKKWQKHWEEVEAFKAEDNSSKPKFYPLIEFPYPSGAGLHVGHPRPYTAMDVVARKRRLEGYNVLFTMGWDAFGLPTENYAIKNKIHPRKVTEDNIKRFKEQLQSLGLSFDWSREIDTTDPDYFKWTQWIFLKFFEHGLAYKKSMTINWCPSCKVGLANEEVVQGCCERCETQVEQRPKEQWMLRITDYAEKLLEGLDEVDFIERVKTQQRNWIGKSEGAEIAFSLYDAENRPLTDSEGADYKLNIFTSRPDTIYGTTYMVISPEHPLIHQFSEKIVNMEALEEYARNAAKKSDFERAEINKDKTGIKIEGISAKNPLSGREMPIFVSDYVLMTYGTGAIMAVPAHDERDYEFAKKFALPIIRVIQNEVPDDQFDAGEHGILVNSPLIDGLSPEDAKHKIVEELEKRGIGKKKINYKLRDWVFSRQRYWGEPMPLVYCEEHGWQGVPESELPVLLPDVENYEPTDNGES